MPFVAVTEEIHTEIVNGHYALLQRAEEVHRRCTEALLGGGGIPQVLGILADFSGNPVFLETTDGQLLYAAGEGPEGADPLQVWEGLRGQHKDTPPSGSALVDVPGGGPGAGSVRARLVLLPVRAPLAPVHRMAAERAAGILAVVLMQARQEEELAARGRGDFLTDLAEGRITPEDAPAQARVLGFKPGSGPLLPVVMRLGDALAPGGGWAVLARAVSEELASVGVPVLLGVRPVEGRVLVLLGLRSESERSAVADRVAAALRAGVERAGMQRPGAQPPVVVVFFAVCWAAASASLSARGRDGDGGAGPVGPPLVRRPPPRHRPAAVAAARPPRPRGLRGPCHRPAARPRRPLQAAPAADPADLSGARGPQGGDGPRAPPQPADPLQPPGPHRRVAGHGPRRPADGTGVEPGAAGTPARALARFGRAFT
ncbi:transcriptional regulator [Streptomyces sviceus ATCC 29083]|uniref:Transcriptional regulator n=1 Tax=Streptomyces sviceus (strain ATCC 29083 / DSM 924 / JCM 4929 / NBRC 13980 / NCIMB 11184 / NRRL 5439 / UC 5370) TaxID=463191 RepID=B5I0I6_STRX2|nr:transcriptional regulator [Streptomyces sviceus ATCC 29083]